MLGEPAMATKRMASGECGAFNDDLLGGGSAGHQMVAIVSVPRSVTPPHDLHRHREGLG